ncbi:MAG: hypothetical protein ACRDQ7_12860 [Haloechinothrix sp.]
MGNGKRSVAAGAAAFLLAGSALLAMPGSAVAATVTGECGDKVTGDVGDRLVVDPSSLLLLPAGTLPKLDFGTIDEGTTTLSKTVTYLLDSAVCKVTVTGIADTVESAAKKATDTAQKTVEDGSKTVRDGAEAVGELLGGSNPPPEGGGPDGGESGRADGGAKEPSEQTSPPAPNSRVLGDTSGYRGLPPGLRYGSLPLMSGFSTLPYTNLAYTPAPALRYGSGIPGYSPEFGILGQEPSSGQDHVQNAGSASALPSSPGKDEVGLPALLAVLALAGASAGLVRTWVLRRAFA